MVWVVLRLDQCKWVNGGGELGRWWWWTCAFQLGDLHIFFPTWNVQVTVQMDCTWIFPVKETQRWLGRVLSLWIFSNEKKHMNFSGKFACKVRRNKTQGTDGLVFFSGDWVNWFTFYLKNSPKKERSERKRTNWHAWNACVGVECCEKGYTNGTHTTDSLAHWRGKKQTPHLWLEHTCVRLNEAENTCVFMWNVCDGKLQVRFSWNKKHCNSHTRIKWNTTHYTNAIEVQHMSVLNQSWTSVRVCVWKHKVNECNANHISHSAKWMQCESHITQCKVNAMRITYHIVKRTTQMQLN